MCKNFHFWKASNSEGYTDGTQMTIKVIVEHPKYDYKKELAPNLRRASNGWKPWGIEIKHNSPDVWIPCTSVEAETILGYKITPEMLMQHV